MKKTVLMALFALMVIGCEKKTTKDVAISTGDICDTLRNIPANTQMERAKWLKENITKFDNELFNCVEEFHRIDSTDAETAMKKFYESTSETSRNDPDFKFSTPLSVKEFKRFNFCSCYDAYVGFDVDAKNVISIKLINGYTEKQPCYSLPFLMGVISKNGMKDTDVFNFTKGIFVTEEDGNETKKERIIIKVINNKTVNKKVVDYEYYDISDDPKKKMI